MKRQSGSAFSAAIFFILGATLLTMAVLAMSKINTFTIRPHLELQRSFYINEGAANRVQWLLAADRQLHPVSTPGDLDYSEFEYDRFLADGTVHVIDYYGTEVEFTITDTRSGFDFSTRNANATWNRIKNAWVTDTDLNERIDILKDLLSDYTDSNDNVSGDGKEISEYESEEKQPLPSNSGLQFRAELFYIEGFTDFFPTDKHGRLTSIRLIPPNGSNANLAGNPSIFTADKFLLMTFCNLEEEEALTVLEALKTYQTERIKLSDQLDATLLPKVRRGLSWNESGYYTVNIRSKTGSGRISKRLTFSFHGFGITGPQGDNVSYLQWIFY
ncbi:MAG: hypothetical protein IJW05_08460 [Lentisphaeria bacterium]|nr:hypothetical protein [Lentisphaeria bacterium]